MKRTNLYNSRYRTRRRRLLVQRALIVTGVVAVAAICGTGAVFLSKMLKKDSSIYTQAAMIISQEDSSAGQDSGDFQEISVPDPVQELIAQADLLASGYDYDGAIELLQSSADYNTNPEVTDAIAGYEATKATLVKADINKITHVFFHSLIVDNSKAFDGDPDEAGYNQVMTTTKEFEKILRTMYNKGYVLVRLHDMAYETTDENGKTVMKPGSIMLPEGKIPFVMSQDDLCYYPYMDGDGFANRMIIGKDGKPTCEMKMEDGSVSVGSYDLVPILEDFITAHPDFSYKGARAVLAFTGYEGILGYRTAASYADSATYEQDRRQAAAVATCLREHGWELASHSWGHLNMSSPERGGVSTERFHLDVDKWEEQVEALIGPTDIILFPFGSDVNDWHAYNSDNDRYMYLKAAGFRYYCNVDSSKYWVQLGEDYLRQGRRNLDGYRMWKDITAEDSSKRKLDDLFRAEDIFDSDRPTPVSEM